MWLFQETESFMARLTHRDNKLIDRTLEFEVYESDKECCSCSTKTTQDYFEFDFQDFIIQRDYCSLTYIHKEWDFTISPRKTISSAQL
jgi:hypothetical protein